MTEKNPHPPGRVLDDFRAEIEQAAELADKAAQAYRDRAKTRDAESRHAEKTGFDTVAARMKDLAERDRQRADAATRLAELTTRLADLSGDLAETERADK